MPKHALRVVFAASILLTALWAIGLGWEPVFGRDAPAILLVPLAIVTACLVCWPAFRKGRLLFSRPIGAGKLLALFAPRVIGAYVALAPMDRPSPQEEPGRPDEPPSEPEVVADLDVWYNGDWLDDAVEESPGVFAGVGDVIHIRIQASGEPFAAEGQFTLQFNPRYFSIYRDSDLSGYTVEPGNDLFDVWVETDLWVQVVGVPDVASDEVITLDYLGPSDAESDSIRVCSYTVNLIVGSEPARTSGPVPVDPIIADARELDGPNLIRVNNDFDEQGTDRRHVNDLDKDGVVAMDGEVRTLLIRSHSSPGAAGTITVLSSEFLKVWYQSEGTWVQGSFISFLDQEYPYENHYRNGYIISRQVSQGWTSETMYIEAQEVPDYWVTKYNGEDYFAAGIREFVSVGFRRQGAPESETRKMDEVDFSVESLKIYCLHSLGTYWMAGWGYEGAVGHRDWVLWARGDG